MTAALACPLRNETFTINLMAIPRGDLKSVLSLVVTLAVSYVVLPCRSFAESLTRPDGQQISGRLTTESGDIRFVPEKGSAAVPLERGSVVTFSPATPSALAGVPSFRLELGHGQYVSGRLGLLDQTSVRLLGGPSGLPVTVARAGVLSVTQRPGEALVFQDGFETLNSGQAGWQQVGEPELAEDPRFVGQHSLRIDNNGSSVTHRLAEPVGTGRLDLAFHDSGAVAPGQQWFVDLLFQGRSGPESIRAILGWSEETLAVESSGGISLAVQRLSRKPGWHRLNIRFGSDQTEVAVDDNELAHGKAPSGPLTEIRIASYSSGKPAEAPGVSAHVDDLRLFRFTEPSGGYETDPSQDEARLIVGDQLFGSLRSADSTSIVIEVLGRNVSLSWSETSGLYLKRRAVQGQSIQGLLVQMSWRSSPGNTPFDVDEIEGALTAVTDSALTIATPYAGTLKVPRDRVVRLRVLGRGQRLVVDPAAHHLGNELSLTAPVLDPPQPQRGPLEETFTLDDIPNAPAALVLDVLMVIGETSGNEYSKEVRDGALRTNVKINGMPVDYLNRHIMSSNEEPERIRIPIPQGLLRKGLNQLRIEQTGRAAEPDELDDLGILGIAVEFSGS